MDYVLGGVAALITGNVTPNRPKAVKKPFTPTKHQASPNVTPKSELVDDRSIFLSPTLQKKKAIVKKSPKRIFQNPDLDITENEDSPVVSPKADKAKKHLKGDLEADNQNVSLKLKTNANCAVKRTKTDSITENKQHSDESTPKKKKKNKDLSTAIIDNMRDVMHKNQTESDISQDDNINSVSKSPKKVKQRRKSIVGDVDEEDITKISESVNEKNNSYQNKNIDDNNQQITQDINPEESPKGKKSRKRKSMTMAQVNKINSTQEFSKVKHTKLQDEKEDQKENITQQKLKKKNKKRNKNKNDKTKFVVTDETNQDNEIELDNIKGNLEIEIPVQETHDEIADNGKTKKKKSKKKGAVNPNAVTDKDSESEHDSDDEIESENEEINKKLLEKEPTDSTSDEEEEKEKIKQPVKKEIEKPERNMTNPDEVKRTLFVGNVPFSKKCKKEIKRIFSKHGQIETVRIRTVPIKDARDTPKLAIIKNELHPDRSTVNVYIKFVDEESVEKALVENNTVLNDHHLRVSRSNNTGAEHDPRCSIFVGNMPFALEDEALRAKFENCGDIDSVRIIRDKKTNAGKGFGYVNFKSKDGVELALALTEEDLTIKNRILRVKRCTQGAQKQGNRFNQHGRKPFGRDQGQGNYRQMGSFGVQSHNEGEGAYRRVMNKRKYQESGAEGPLNKHQNTNEPRREKKTRKEFVGMTAEKKKKHKFDKSQKKKKMLSEILTK